MKKYTILFFVILISVEIFARMGGAGGGDSGGGGGGDFGSGSSGGDGDGDGGEFIALIIYAFVYLASLPFPMNVISFAVLIFLAWLGYRKYRTGSPLNAFKKVEAGIVPENRLTADIAGLKNFNQKEFTDKMKKAFFEMQMAWSEKKLGKVRKFISDGMYQRFSVQMMMMDELKQTNKIKTLDLKEFKIVMVESEPENDIIHVQVKAYIADQFLSGRFPELDQKFNETFVEYWTFARKKNATGNDIYTDDKCPNCKAVLPENMGEVSVCESCGSFTNLGDHDWVLCEITQLAQFIRLSQNNSSRSSLLNSVYQRIGENFSAQWLEDKASNAFLQLKVAHAMRDVNRIRRFSTKEFAEKFKIADKDGLLYNRLFIEQVTMVNLFEDGENIIAPFHINFMEQRVRVADNKLEIIDNVPYANEVYVLLTKKKKSTAGRFSAFAHKCSSCGATAADSLKLECEYCGNVLNDDSKDWIVYDYLNISDYMAFRNSMSNAVYNSKQERKVEKVDIDIRDYALNNMMVIMSADGSLSDKERDHAFAMAKKMGYNAKNVSALWELSASGKLGVKMPDEKKKREKVYKIMEKAAMADDEMSPAEESVLKEIREKFLN